MLFTSLAFFIFLAITLIFYYALPKKCQWVVLLVASLVFYISFSWKFLFFIISTIVTVYGATRGIDKVNTEQEKYLAENELDLEQKKNYKAKNKKKKKLYITLCILFNIGILFVLKYANFVIASFQGIVSLFGVEMSPITLHLILPLGISFYTFQIIGYLADVYWGKVACEKNIFKLALFTSFFPQILQGPISRHSELAPQFEEKKKFDYDKVMRGVMLILWGLFKKLLIADVFGSIVSNGFDKVAQLNGLQTWFTIICYLIQDYTDFSGCIDIAMGVAECFGIKLAPNFERPYFSLSVEEYWRRWHMTLGSWFKDYIFYPISISKFSINFGKFCKKHSKKNSYIAKQLPAILGLIVTWASTGLWHGASWNYVFWGLYYGLIIIMNILLRPLYNKIIQKLKINENAWWYKLFHWVKTMWLLSIGRVIFRCNSLGDVWTMFVKTWDFIFRYNVLSIQSLLSDAKMFAVAGIALIFVIVIDLIKEFKKDISIRDEVRKRGYTLQTCIIIALIIVLVLFGSYGPGFTAQDFIYMQF